MPVSQNRVMITITKSFSESSRRLPPNVMQDFNRFLMKFMQDPTSPGLNYEKLNALNPRLRSARVNLGYRAIIMVPENGAKLVYALLWVDAHDAAYNWARRKRVFVAVNSPVVQMYDVAEDMPEGTACDAVSYDPITSIHAQNINTTGVACGDLNIEQTSAGAVGIALFEASEDLFKLLRDEELLRLGVPPENLFLLRRIRTDEELDLMKRYLPVTAYERLFLLRANCSLEEVMQHKAYDLKDLDSTISVEEAMLLPENRDQILTVESGQLDASILAMATRTLEDWRVFLHPAQRKFVETEYDGPAKILGEAGTGKTVVAMHRAKWLVENIFTGRGDRVLFTTYTVNLADDIAASLKQMCHPELFSRIDIMNLDKWVAGWLAGNGCRERLIFGNDVVKIWDEAISIAAIDIKLPWAFFAQEYEKVILAGEIDSLEQYRHTSRTGRGIALNRFHKAQVWKVMEIYQQMLAEKNVLDGASAAIFVAKKLRCEGGTGIYKAIVLDEAQDFGAVSYRLIRAMAGETHPNDIFIVGDTHQRIYGRKVVLKKCGIDTTDRFGRLKINYRTSEENRKFASNIIRDMSVDDMDAAEDEGKGSVSLRHGKDVILHQYANAGEEQRGVCDTVQKWIAFGVPAESLCIMAHNTRILDGIRRELIAKGIRVYEIKNRNEDRGIPGVRMGTMHRAKGLEFECVLIAGVNDGIVPSAAALNAASDAIEKKEVMEMERSLLYTAVTRAKSELVLTCSGRPSPFIQAW